MMKLLTRAAGSIVNRKSAAGRPMAGAARAEVRPAEPRPSDDLLRHLPVNRPASTVAGPVAGESYELAGDRLERHTRAANALGVDLDAFLLTAFAILIARLAAQEVVTIRDIAPPSRVLNLAFDPEVTFRMLLTEVTGSAMSSPFTRPCGLEFECAASPAGDQAPQSLRMTVGLSSKGARIRLQSTTGLWNQAVLGLWLRYFDYLLAAAAGTPDLPWKRLPLLDASEVPEFYRGLNDTAAAFPSHSCVHQMVSLQTQQTPNALAVLSESQQYTYRQLEQRSNAFAHHLRALGAGPGRSVAVCLERSAELPVALLGVLKAGSSYVPLDPEDARHRLETIVEECRPVAILAGDDAPALRTASAIPVVHLADIEPATVTDYAPSGVTPDHDAYIIFTSGTTGKPKGVAICHRALVNLLSSMRRQPGFTSDDRLLAVAPISFDIATMDMFLPLVSGGTLVVADRFAAADPFRLAAMLSRFEISVLQATPVTWRLLAASAWEGKSDLTMISGGEALARDLANQLLRLGGELWNCYGPTETTIYSAVLRLASESGVVPIGPPMANTTFYVLDETGRLLPPGVAGELHIGGTGVSAGYVGQPQLNAERFVPDPYSPIVGARMFRSGDLVRLINRNEFEFHGRLDHQIKLRGYRIELGEIESALRTFPGIEHAAAALHQSVAGEPNLIAYVTAHNRSPDLRQLRDHVSTLLSPYMVPSRFVVLQTMPLTGSGKMDRKALATVAVTAAFAAYQQPAGVKPETATEASLLTIFREVLDTTEFGVTDSFFDYGGYSLLTVKLFARIHRVLHLTLPVSLLFDAPTVRALASMIDRAQAPPMIVPVRARGKSAPLFVIHSYLLYGVLPQIVEQDRPVYGVRESADFDRDQTVEQRAAKYVAEILNVHPHGPVLLTGWCAAGSLTVEIARQLHELDHPVGLVALFDAERPGYRSSLRGNRLARLTSSLRFHAQHLRAAGTRDKMEYVRDALLHKSDMVLESLFTRHHKQVVRLQRMLGSSLPDFLFNNNFTRVAAIQNHAPANYPGKVVLFRAQDVPATYEHDETLGWRDVVNQGVEVVFVPGDHETMFQDPNVGIFSKRLRLALQQGEHLVSPAVH